MSYNIFIKLAPESGRKGLQMKLNPYCMCCAVNKQEEKIRKFPDMDKKTEYMKKVMSILSSAKEQDCSMPALETILILQLWKM